MKKRIKTWRISKKHRALMLRTCAADMTGHGGFQWPDVGGVATAPDWNDRPECGGGLHGCLWGEGGDELLSPEDDSRRWLVCEVDDREVVQIGAKVKVPRARVLHVGDRNSAPLFLHENGGRGRPIAYLSVSAGYRGTATAGDGGTATAGYWGTATAGYGGTATAGDGGRIEILWYDGCRYRKTIGYVGEDGIQPGVAYRCAAQGKLVRK